MENLKKNLEKNLKLEENDIEENEDGSITFNLDETRVTVDKNGQVELRENVPIIEATSIEAENLTIKEGTKTEKLKVTTIPSEITESLIYTSKNTEVITVENDGTVIVKGEGTAKVEIEGKKSGTKGECVVTVEFGVGVKVTNENKKYINNGTAVIPVGFCIVPGCNNVSEGLVISDDDEDTELNKDNIVANGNQFVWIPVTDPNSYKLNENYVPSYFSGKIVPDTDYLPTGVEVLSGKTEQEIEKELVTKDGIEGFYISRYEAGDDLAQSARTSETEGKLVSKKNAYVYTYVRQTNNGEESKILGAKEKAKTFINNQYVKSALITGIQWDMVMAFISKKERLDGTNTQIFDVEKGLACRHLEDGVKQSGQNPADKVCNIYDLEGNCWEYVAEQNTYSGPYTSRGGSYSGNDSASCRYGNDGDAYYNDSIRFILYVM